MRLYLRMLVSLDLLHNLQSVASGDFLLSHYHVVSYVDMGVLCCPQF